MLFHVACRLEYDARFPSTLILNVHAQQNASQTVVTERLVVEPDLAVHEFTPPDSQNRFAVLNTGHHPHVTIDYTASVECDFDVLSVNARETPTPIEDLSAEAIPFLFPSRYCQSDRLSRLAWDLFGSIESPHQRAVAISDWIHANVEYLPGSTDSVTSAYDTVTQRTGVCRDFSHLAIALCRALNIPARYVSGYAYQLVPPDFHACFECFIDGRWVVFDATRLSHLNGLVRIGTGRDAADAAVASIFGAAFGTRMDVTCELGEGQSFVPIDREQLERARVSLESATSPRQG